MAQPTSMRNEWAVKASGRFPLVVSVGIPVGTQVIPWETSASEVRAGIRCGGKYISFPMDHYEVWLYAIGGVRLDRFYAWGRDRGIDDIEQAVTDLVGMRLFWRMSGTLDVDSEQFDRIRVIPRGVGLGNSMPEPHRYAIGDQDFTPTLTVDFVAYNIWTFCDGALSYRAACEATAKHLAMNIADVLARAESLIPALMGNKLAYLDTIPGEPDSFDRKVS